MIAKMLSAALAVSTAAGVCSAYEIDRMAAKVNADVILQSEVVNEMRRTGAGREKYAAVLDELIEKRLIVKAAAEAKMTLQDWVIERSLNEIIERSFDGDRNRLMAALAQMKVSYAEWRRQMVDNMIVSAMRWQTIDKNVTASPAAMREEYAANPARYTRRGTATVSVILLKPEDIGKRADVLAALKTESFGDVARRYSADSRSASGGVWKDVVPQDVFRAEVCAELAATPIGTISRWVELDGWSFLLRKDDETPARQLSFTEAYAEIEAAVREKIAAQRYTAWIKRLKAAAYIKIFK